jgi:galactonate dehydratase
VSRDRVRELGVSVAEITPKTRWIFVEMTTDAGLRGVGEGSLNGEETAVAEAVAQLAPVVFALTGAAPAQLMSVPLPGLAEAAAFSAIDQALWDIEAQRQGVRLAEAMGAVRRTSIPLYANINRRTLDRSPAGFAMSARDAVAAGHEAFKVAPFDEATMEARRAGSLAAAIEPGIRRIEAVRAEIGPERRLMVDCHWRLDEAASELVIAATAEMGVHWVECPLPETPDQFAALTRLRGLANRRDMLLAGCEQSIGTAGFLPFLKAGAYDVMMPDVKYVGGLAEIMRLADVLRKAGVGFSPHNPSGPVCHAASLQLCAAVADLHSLETQFDETPLFDELAGQRLQAVAGGVAALPATAGLGMVLQPSVLERCRTVYWTATRQGDEHVINKNEAIHGERHVGSRN